MTTRQPLQTLSPPSTTLNTRHTVRGANGYAAMEGQDDTQDAGSVVSGLSSLENDADDFERLMIQNARDERRLNEALHGRAQAFRKARTHPRVGLTMDNLERNDARNDAVGANAHVKFQSPPSSSGSTRSDPAIHAPAGWGRKSRVNRNWMRTITHDEDPPQTPVAPDETVNGRYGETSRQHANDAHNANIPRHSVEDSPLSHKSSRHGTPQNDRSAEWDLTFELNEASMIASTPYIPRSTVLDDIRQREMESMREPITTAREVAQTDAVKAQGGTQAAPPPQKPLRTRTNSWKSIGKSQAVTGIGRGTSPITVYKSAETVDTVEHEGPSGTENQQPKRVGHRRGDSQDLLRRLARASHTPSPGRVAPRPQTAPAKQSPVTSQTVLTNRPSTARGKAQQPAAEHSMDDSVLKPAATASDEPAAHEKPGEAAQATKDSSLPSKLLPEVEDIDTTPMPIAQPLLDSKTPVVTGAWVDTPGPKTALRPVTAPETQAPSPRKPNRVKEKSPEKLLLNSPEELAFEGVAAETIRPSLPGSALQALVQEAKASGRRPSADFGDSTINSLEDLIDRPDRAEGVMDEDTLQGLQLPTGTPRNEAERQRQEEVVHLHRMNDRLRAARTSIRDASRGMRRVEDRVDHVEEGKASGERVVAIYQDCPCASNGGQHFSLWRWTRSFFWQERIKAERQASNSRLKRWGGFTTLGIFALVFFTWWISEEIACEMYCHPMYAQWSPYPFAVNMNAPHYPYVIPTLIYRNLIKAWWLPLYSFLCWIGTATYGLMFNDEVTRQTVVEGTARASASRTVQSIWHATSQAAQQVAEEIEWDLRMDDDQLVR